MVAEGRQIRGRGMKGREGRREGGTDGGTGGGDGGDVNDGAESESVTGLTPDST